MAAAMLGISPSTVKRHLADLRAKSGLTTGQLIYAGRAEGWLVVPSLETGWRDRADEASCLLDSAMPSRSPVRVT